MLALQNQPPQPPKWVPGNVFYKIETLFVTQGGWPLNGNLHRDITGILGRRGGLGFTETFLDFAGPMFTWKNTVEIQGVGSKQSLCRKNLFALQNDTIHKMQRSRSLYVIV